MTVYFLLTAMPIKSAFASTVFVYYISATKDGRGSNRMIIFIIIICSKTISMHSVRKQHRAHSVAFELSET